MNQRKLAEARRLYHHVCNGGTLTPKDVSFMVVALEEAYGEVERLRAKKKQIYEDLKDSVKRKWVGLTRDEFKLATEECLNEEDYWEAIESKLKEKNT